MRTIWDRSVSAADALRPHDEAARAVDCPTRNRISLPFGHGNRLASHHGLVDGARASDEDAVHRHLLAGSDAEVHPRFDVLERGVFLATVSTNDPRRFWRQAQQCFERARRAVASAKLKNLPEEHERHDHRGRLEVDADDDAVAAKPIRKQTRGQGGDEAVAKGRARAERDKGKQMAFGIHARSKPHGLRIGDVDDETSRPGSRASDSRSGNGRA